MVSVIKTNIPTFISVARFNYVVISIVYLQVLEEACTKQGFLPASDYGLKLVILYALLNVFS